MAKFGKELAVRTLSGTVLLLVVVGAVSVSEYGFAALMLTICVGSLWEFYRMAAKKGLSVDHILGFFRIWEIPTHAVHGLLGYFNPALPYSADELRGMGFDTQDGRYTTPVPDEHMLGELFGDLAGEVRATCIECNMCDHSSNLFLCHTMIFCILKMIF